MDVYATQGGGLAMWCELQQCWVFYESPKDFPNMQYVPEQWGIGGFVKHVD